MTKEEIHQVLERFDFDKVLAYMKLVNWKDPKGMDWTLPTLREAALELLRVAFNAQGEMLPPFVNESCGLSAWVNESDRIVLHFYIESKTSYPL